MILGATGWGARCYAPIDRHIHSRLQGGRQQRNHCLAILAQSNRRYAAFEPVWVLNELPNKRRAFGCSFRSVLLRRRLEHSQAVGWKGALTDCEFAS